jgi:hypothetical protein
MRAWCLGITMCAVLSFGLNYGVKPVIADETAPKTLNSFQGCVEQGGRLEESFPSVCISKDGARFVQSDTVEEPPAKGKRACTDRCGDGQCQEIVCMAIGCPCAETHQTCPKDCPE